MGRKRGLASGVIAQYGSSIPGAPATVKRPRINQTKEQRQAAARQQAAEISSLTFEQREMMIAAGDEFSDLPFNPTDTLPPGEEGYFHSHAGDGIPSGDDDEDLDYLHDVQAGIETDWVDVKEVHDIFVPRRIDQRTRRDRIQLQTEAWNQVLEPMVDAFLEWQRTGVPDNTNIPTDEQWEFTVVSFTAIEPRVVWHPPKSEHMAVTYARHGIIASSPHRPSIGFDINLLVIFRQLHRVCPRLSIDALGKALYHIHKMPPKTSLATQISAAYDVYLSMQRIIRSRKEQALKRTSKYIRQTLQCPPCFYELIDDPPLSPAWMGSMDGNNSLKLYDEGYHHGQKRYDSRELSSDQWVEADDVDIFKDEVANSQRGQKTRARKTAEGTSRDEGDPDAATADVDNLEHDIAYLNINELEGLEECINACVDRWKNAQPEARKKMWDVFSVSGIFVVACRHGHLLAICDMRKSGELMKYPLALLNKIMDEYGPDARIGYDIWCSFVTTLSRSTLGKKMLAVNLAGVVPAFHGHAHNRLCQHRWHPTFTEGCGLEDYEGCERMFNLSNNLAGVTRLATAFHRRQELVEHFDFQDADKHLASGRFIYNNYVQALNRILIEGTQLAKLCAQLSVSHDELEAFHQEEYAYLQDLAKAQDTDDGVSEYISLLLKGAKLQKASDDAAAIKREMDTSRQSYTPKEIKSIESKWTTTYRRWEVHEHRIIDHEERYYFSPRWTPETDQFRDGLRRMRETKYRQLLGELEGLLVQRMLEMTKLSMSGVGYKQRDKICKALRARGGAIRTALKKYNKYASSLSPPRPALTLPQIVSMAAEGDFDVLRDLREDTTPKRWADPRIREAVTLMFRVRRAHEEISRCNVELRRLITFIIDEYNTYLEGIEAAASPGLKHELQCEFAYRQLVHRDIVKHIKKVSALKGFTGTLVPSQAADQTLSPGTHLIPKWLTSIIDRNAQKASTDGDNTENDEDGDSEDSDDVNDSFERMMDWADGIE